jgi:hypothetical protein
MTHSELIYDKIPEEILESLYAIFDWGYKLVVVSGRILLIDGEIQMADYHQQIDEHFITAKDITTYVIRHTIHLSKSQQQEGLASYLSEIRTRTYRFHKDEKYFRLSNRP